MLYYYSNYGQKENHLIIYIFLILIQMMSAEEYRFADSSSWIKKIVITVYEQNREDIINGEYYLLSDMQVRTNQRAFYNHYAILLADTTALENNAQITIDFDPVAEELIIHGIQIYRHGQIINKSENALISVIEKENELEKLLRKGTRTFYARLPDIRVGNILEVSYPPEKEDPLFSLYSHRFYIEWAVPVKKIYRRILTGDESLDYRFNTGRFRPVGRYICIQ